MKGKFSDEILFSTTFDFKEWGDDVKIIENLPYNPPSPHTLLDELKFCFLVYKESFYCRAMLLDSSNGTLYPDLLACVLMSFTPRRQRPKIVLAGEMWQPNRGFRRLVEQLIVKLADRVIGRYLVLSSEDMDFFPELWGLNKEKTRLLPYFFTFSEHELASSAPAPQNFIFAGGNAHRDYRPLVDAARCLPDHQFVFATDRLKRVSDLPSNVKAGPVSHSEFIRLMRACELVVVPIAQNLHRSAGQQTYLNAMNLKKSTIVSQVFGVADHIDHMEDAIVVDGSVEGYVDAINWVYDPDNKENVERMREKAHEKVARRFTVQNYINTATGHMREFLTD